MVIVSTLAQALKVSIVKVSRQEVSKSEIIDTSKWLSEKEKLKNAQVDREITLLVEVDKGVDQNGIKVQITYLRSCQIVPECATGLSSGRYHVKFTPNKRGRYTLSIEVNSIDIAGSPINMFVKIPPTKLGDCVAKIPGLKYPGGLACSRNEDILVCEIGGGQISMINSHFKMVGVLAEGLEAPAEVTLDSDSNIYVSTAGDNKIHKLDKDGKHLIAVGSNGTEGDQFHFPNGSCVWNDRLYVCDTRNNRIKVYDLELNRVKLIEIDEDEEKGIIGHFGEKPGEFREPSDLKFDKKGNMYVTDKYNHRVQVLSPEGKPIREFGADGQLKSPVDLQLTDDYVFVTELDSNQVSVFNLDGKFITTFGKGYLHQPNGITIDHDGYVYISSFDKQIHSTQDIFVIYVF